MCVIGKINFGYSDRQRLSRQVLENGAWGAVVVRLGVMLSLEQLTGAGGGHFPVERVI